MHTPTQNVFCKGIKANNKDGSHLEYGRTYAL